MYNLQLFAGFNTIGQCILISASSTDVKIWLSNTFFTLGKHWQLVVSNKCFPSLHFPPWCLAKNNYFAASNVKLCSDIGFRNKQKTGMIAANRPPTSPKHVIKSYFTLLCSSPSPSRLIAALNSKFELFWEVENRY